MAVFWVGVALYNEAAVASIDKRVVLMNNQQLAAYLTRIGLDAVPEPTLKALMSIQECHIYSIPVENLDILEGRVPLSLDIDDLYEKIVERRRGGISFELAVLLADALNTLGFEAVLASAVHPRFGNEFDHALILAKVPNESGTWLVDVGFTESPRTCLLLDGRMWQGDGRDEFRLKPVGGELKANGERVRAVVKAAEGTDEEASCSRAWQLVRRRNNAETLEYTFTAKPCSPQDYAERCAWFCQSSKSRFTQGPFVSIERPEGRVQLFLDTVRNTYTGEVLRPLIETQEDYEAVLREIFGIEVGDGEAADAGMSDARPRVFAAIADDDLLADVVRRAVDLAMKQGAHLRFGHIASEADQHDASLAFPAYVQKVREELGEKLDFVLDAMGAERELFGGELVVMGSNSSIGATIDTPVNFAPAQLVESLIKPFGPASVVCGQTVKPRWALLLKGSTSDYLAKKLDCELVLVARRAAA